MGLNSLVVWVALLLIGGIERMRSLRCVLLRQMFAWRGLSACLCHEKWLNGSRSCLGRRLLGPKRHCIRWGSRSRTARGGGFDAAFAKLLWPLVILANTIVFFVVFAKCMFLWERDTCSLMWSCRLCTSSNYSFVVERGLSNFMKLCFCSYMAPTNLSQVLVRTHTM